MKCNKRQQQLAANETIKPNKHQRVLETIVKNATQMWCSNPIHLRNPLQFLQLSSHCINDTFMEASQIHLAMDLSDTHDVNQTNADTDDDGVNGDERIFNAVKSNTINRKTKASAIKDFKKNSINESGIGSSIDATTTNVTDCIDARRINGHNDSVNSVIHIEAPAKTAMASNSNLNSNEINFNKSEPPPLAFYPKKNRGNLQTPIIFSATEPPPLVPIARFNFA